MLLRRWLLRPIAVVGAALLVGYVIGFDVSGFTSTGQVRLVNLGLQLLTWDFPMRSVGGLQVLGPPDAGLLFATIALAAVTGWMARETRRLAIASKDQLSVLRADQTAKEQPTLDWSVREGSPWFDPEANDNDSVWILVPCDATNVGGAATVGPLEVIEGVAFVHDQSLKPRILAGQTYSVVLAFGPFRRGVTFDTWCVLRQKYNALRSDETLEDHVLVWTSHDWRNNEAWVRIIQVFPDRADYTDYKRALIARLRAMVAARRAGMLVPEPGSADAL